MSLPWHRTDLTALLARQERLPHALLVRGTEGIGKLAFAMGLAQALLCERPAGNGESCGVCRGCAWFLQGSHPDFRMLEPKPAEVAEEGGEGRDRKGTPPIDVHQVRDLADFINLTSHRGGARVVLIHPAEALNINAANALLKSLEEPPPRTYFLLVSHRWHQLLPTVRSRCQHVALPLPETKPAREWLEAQGVENADLALGHAGGAPLLAAKLDADYWRARDRLLGLLDGGDFDPLAAAEALKDAAPALVVTLLQKWSFDLAFQRVAGRVRYNPDCANAAASVAARLDALEVLRFHRRTVQLQREVHHPLNPRLFLEDLFLAYAGLLRAGDSRRAA